MIVELNISNFAIIDSLNINFTNGFNVLTGETGAGKSIIVEGISMILGGRANKNLVKTGKEKAILEGLFYLEDPNRVNNTLNDYGIDVDESNYLLISREIYANGGSVSRVNGRTVTLTMLNSITSTLVDVHGQHEHQSLLNINNHIKLIDTFGDMKLKDLLNNVESKYEDLTKEIRRLEELSLDSIERDREIDLLKYQLDEIDNANLLNFDEEVIIREHLKMTNIKEIIYKLGEVSDILDNEIYGSLSLLDGINKCVVNLKDIEKFDSRLQQYNATMENIGFELQDLSRDIKNYLESIEIDEERLEFLEERIDTINVLKKKYGNTIDNILEYRESINNRLEVLLNNEKEIEKSNHKIRDIENQLVKYCTCLTDIRKTISKDIEISIMRELRELNMSDVVFQINFNKLNHFTPNGWDRVEFLISTNRGEDLKPLSKIVSGGEMSRIMLAFKTILADYDNIPCLIFDEIDTGISGRTAQVVGEKIKMVSNSHQVICISHLPQIAALADTHFVIEKDVIDNNTITKVRKLNEEERIEELSRLLGGVDLTDTTKLHAKEMLEMSKMLKN
ncbi:DNA repair protein RecN [Clostridium sp. Cult3]|uniref:DNA repair protein RecN n=1 Tax=Clostridium sp. Cult3 TaxID=2079004 RepID=UPI001EFFAE5D|nr:DNA repair protein RecN [Clostridium sp. Cult3]MCF6460104.1 DNA repair protein RecN [Clostridium sp. Cult3]